MAHAKLKPGTYRIVNAAAGTAIQVLDHDPTKVVGWERHEGENQQWFLQTSGDGCRFKNRRYGSYLAVSSTGDHALVYGSKYPMTWILLKHNNSYVIQFPGNSRALDLHWGRATNGNEIHIWSWPANNEPHRTWKFEYLSDETGEVQTDTLQKENDRLRRDLDAKTDVLSCKERELDDKEKQIVEGRANISKRDTELAQLRDEISNKEMQLSDQRALTSQYESTIHRLEEILKAKEEALTYAYKSNEETSHLRDQKTHLQGKLSQQQNEMASIQAKMDRFEYLMSQMMSKNEGSAYHGTYSGA